MSRIRTLSSKVAGRFRRWIERRPDVYVIGYPKVGNTWFQFMLRRALVDYFGLPEERTWSVLFEEGPAAKGVPLVITTHHMPRYNEESYRRMVLQTQAVAGRKLILLVREPKDTLVSLYMHNRYRCVPPLYTGTLDEMVRSEVYGIEKYLKFYRAWCDARGAAASFLLVRYEDLKRDTAAVMREALAMVGMEGISPRQLSRVIEFGSFENMRRMEQQGQVPLETLKRPEDDRPESFKTRRGIVGGYREHLSAETIAWIDRRTRQEMPALYGYGRQ